MGVEIKEWPPPAAVGETLMGGARSQRLADKILMAVHHACDERDFEAAEGLLGTLERIVTRPGQNPSRREDTNRLVMAYERLWMLNRPEAQV